MKDLSQEEWKSKFEDSENAILIDVRSPDEWQQGIIPDAKMIDLMEINDFLVKVKKMDNSRPCYVYCRSGVRSHQACLVLDQMGFNETYNLEGGILEWDGDIV